MTGHVLAADPTLADFNTLIWWMVLLKVAIVFVFLLLTTMLMIWAERRSLESWLGCGHGRWPVRLSGRCGLPQEDQTP